MSKVCGIISPNADSETVREQLQAMVDTMWHDAHLHAEMVLFEHGEIIVLKSKRSVEQHTYQDSTSLNSLALCGHVIGRSGDYDHELESPIMASSSDQLSGLLHRSVGRKLRAFMFSMPRGQPTPLLGEAVEDPGIGYSLKI